MAAQYDSTLDYLVANRLERSHAVDFAPEPDAECDMNTCVIDDCDTADCDTADCDTADYDTADCDEPSSGDLLPWADPYIAKLVRRHELQCAQQRRNRAPYEGEPTVQFAPRNEAPVPMPARTNVPKTNSRYNRQPRPAAPAKPTHSK